MNTNILGLGVGIFLGSTLFDIFKHKFTLIPKAIGVVVICLGVLV